MCRKNHLLGGVLLAFGLGLLIGKCLQGGLISTFVGLAIIFAGWCLLRQK